MSESHLLAVSQLNKETPNSVCITFEIPDALREKYRYKAGQYITIKYLVDGKEIRRAYSICSAPSSGLLQVGVKKVSDGAFSEFANTTLKEGDALDVMLPEGKFILNPEASTSKNYAAFVAGSGITPVLSIIQAVMEEEPLSSFVLVYGNQTLEEAMFYSELLKLKERYPNRFQIEWLFSRKQEEGAMFGRIERSTVNYILKNKYKELNFHEFYLCGPEPMIDEVASVLKEHGFNQKQIHFELFTTAEKGMLVEPHDGTTQITVTVDDETATFTMPQNKSVLEAVLEQKIDAPYSCQGGICSTCIARIVEGKAEMRKNQILTDDEIAEGLVLTCQAHPTSATLVIDYDDV
ncbi:ring-1,2-phenylacetyl-CoA epoxidase subunit PaaE [Ulvibacter sp. MAR_2010_11]|uniref:ferredoxin--NADP reductase n=1 Tax=Ulvibacter sp. MAR_2010_11 TaxID=1250229 RepID=UPI000C2C9A56|nr:ferredoxin--NADP reductase [Ulvibacter sp. MAR_2010_11]PKA82900.1 ring-1,2-phenylacetyl-CoA epoxidase subunit PaaE [Ulvibacter sp. MAR_2010_11]